MGGRPRWRDGGTRAPWRTSGPLCGHGVPHPRRSLVGQRRVGERLLGGPKSRARVVVCIDRPQKAHPDMERPLRKLGIGVAG